MSAVTSDALEVLAPEGAVVTFRGEQLRIVPIPVGDIPRLVRVLRPVMQALSIDASEVASIDITPDLVMQLVADHAPALFEAVALCSGKPASHIEGGDLAEFIALVLKVVEVNRDFFTRQVAPLLAGLLARVRGAGPMPSSS